MITEASQIQMQHIEVSLENDLNQFSEAEEHRSNTRRTEQTTDGAYGGVWH